MLCQLKLRWRFVAGNLSGATSREARNMLIQIVPEGTTPIRDQPDSTILLRRLASPWNHTGSPRPIAMPKRISIPENTLKT